MFQRSCNSQLTCTQKAKNPHNLRENPAHPVRLAYLSWRLPIKPQRPCREQNLYNTEFKVSVSSFATNKHTIKKWRDLEHDTLKHVYLDYYFELKGLKKQQVQWALWSPLSSRKQKIKLPCEREMLSRTWRKERSDHQGRGLRPRRICASKAFKNNPIIFL